MKEKGISQRELSVRIGRRGRAVEKWLYDGTLPSVEDGIKIAEVLGVSVEYLFYGYDKTKNELESLKIQLRNILLRLK